MAYYGRIQNPLKLPVTTDEFLAHARITSPESEVDLIESYIRAATDYVESLCGPLINQTWAMYLEQWPVQNYIEIQKPRVHAENLSLTYTDRSGGQHMMRAEDYYIDYHHQYPRLVLAENTAWPAVELARPDPVVIEFVAGYGEETFDVPFPIRAAILIFAAHLYENRILLSKDSLAEVPFSVTALLANYRQGGI